MLINSPDCSICLFSWYGLLIMVGGDFSHTRRTGMWYDCFRPKLNVCNLSTLPLKPYWTRNLVDL